jgi:hypothetical protein
LNDDQRIMQPNCVVDCCAGYLHINGDELCVGGDGNTWRK